MGKRKSNSKIPAPPVELRLGEFKEKLVKEEVLSVLDVMKKTENMGSKGKEMLLEDVDGQKINLQIAGIKLPRDNRRQIIKIKLPHEPLGGTVPEVCLIIKDAEKGIKADHEPGVETCKELLAEKGIGAVSGVLTLRQLRVEYKTFESKTSLCHKYDAFLADSRIMRFLPKYLGKPFIKRKKFPIQINMDAKDLKSEINNSLKMSVLPLNHHGTCSMVTVGNSLMTTVELADNILCVGEALVKHYPGGWKNIRSIHLKSGNSLSLPLHVSSISANDLGFVDASNPKKNLKMSVSDELSTVPGAVVTVNPFGGIKISRESDSHWDAEKEEPFISGSEVDESSEEEEELPTKKRKKAKAKKLHKDFIPVQLKNNEENLDEEKRESENEEASEEEDSDGSEESFDNEQDLGEGDILLDSDNEEEESEDDD